MHRGSISNAIAECSGRRLEHGLTDVVRIAAVVKNDVQVHSSLSGDRLPEIGDQFAVERADLGRRHRHVPDPVSTSTQIDGAGDECFVHGENRVAIAPNAGSDRLTPGRSPVPGRSPHPRSCGVHRRAGRPCSRPSGPLGHDEQTAQACDPGNRSPSRPGPGPGRPGRASIGSRSHASFARSRQYGEVRSSSGFLGDSRKTTEPP